MPSSYLQHPLTNWSDCVEQVAAAIKKSNIKFDAIAVRGTSGLLVGPGVAAKLGTNLIIVRKPNDSSHGSVLEYPNGFSSHIKDYLNNNLNYIIIDDLVSSGTTVRLIHSTIGKNEGWIRKCVGIFLYSWTELDADVARCNHKIWSKHNFGYDVPLFGTKPILENLE